MADAWARLTGEVGVAMVTGGPGHANAVSALYTAAMAESPVLLLSGHAPHNQLGMGAFQEMRQADVAEPLTKWSGTVAGADRMAQQVGQALRAARAAAVRAGQPGVADVTRWKRHAARRPTPRNRSTPLRRRSIPIPPPRWSAACRPPGAR